MQKSEQTVIIVAPPHTDVRVVHAPAAEMVTFMSADEFVDWMGHQSQPGGSLRDDVTSALREISCTVATLPVQLRQVIQKLAEAFVVPDLDALERGCSSSRSSFYRLWGASIGESPSAFLRRVRATHARRLLAGGMSRKKAALSAGYTSVDQMSRSLRRNSRR